MTGLEALYKLTELVKDEKDYFDKALDLRDVIEKALKALDIIKTHRIYVGALLSHNIKCADDYNYIYGDNLTQQEYDLLKEDLL